MASEAVSNQEQTKPLEEEVAVLSLQEKDGVIADAVDEYLDGVNEAARISAESGELNKSAKETSKATEVGEGKPSGGSSKATEVGEGKPSDGSNSREVDIADKEAEKSPDEGAYVVSTVDHRSVQQPAGEEKVEVPTGVVHENADQVGNPPQQGKGLIQSITQSVKSVFSGITGGKAAKSSEVKGEATTE